MLVIEDGRSLVYDPLQSAVTKKYAIWLMFPTGIRCTINQIHIPRTGELGQWLTFTAARGKGLGHHNQRGGVAAPALPA